MCNITEMVCKNCGNELREPIHIIDYMCREDEFEVYCEDCLPEYNIRVFIMSQIHGKWVIEERESYRIGIRYLTNKAKQHAHGIHPNTCMIMKYYDI